MSGRGGERRMANVDLVDGMFLVGVWHYDTMVLSTLWSV